MDYSNPANYDSETVEKIVGIVSEQYHKDFPPIRLNGCGRIYVCLGYRAIRANSKLAKALVAKGVKMFKTPGITGVSIYVGYDNAHGGIAAKGEAIVKAIKEAFPTMPAYVDYQGD